MVNNFIEEKIEIPSDIEISIEDSLVKVKGPKGENERKFIMPLIKISKEENTVLLKSNRKTKKEKRYLNTIKSHIQNLINGTIEKYTCTLKVLSSHFPMTIAIENNELVIKNFLGEKIPRRAKILEGTDVKIEGDIITVTSTNIESAGQTAANMEQACRITNKDRRVFQDGCWVTSKTKDKK
ncbi:50S ribosomal protein L6 [archaeon]|nr:50S ribosomal protein L6 [archaeon]|tara:strand:+ start:1606 stop:2151 length:546 start_codon:yes stop_codon:yes gene_type:complete